MFRLSKYLAIIPLVVLIAVHLSLINKTFSQDSEGNFRAASAGYGDIPFHMTQVSKFAFQNHIDFNEPIFDGERMRYAFGINLLSGIILRYSYNWPFAMHLPAMSFMTLGIILTFLSYRSILRSQFGAVFAVFIFLLGAGFGTSYLISDYSLRTNNISDNFFEYIVDTTASTATKWNAQYPDQNIAWGSPLSLVFLHQRAFFFGFFMFSLFWYLLWNFLKNPENIKGALAIGLVVGLTPLTHYHSFVAMLAVLGVIGFDSLIKKKTKVVGRLFIAGVIILALAVPQILYLVLGKNDLTSSLNPFVQFRLGWMSQPTIGSIQFGQDNSFRILPFLNFLWINFGVVLPMFLFSSIVFFESIKYREHFRKIYILGASGLVLFLLVQMIRFQPWDYDDNKILVYFQFFAAPVIVSVFLWIATHKKLTGWFLLSVFTIIAIHSGVVDQIPRLAVPISETPVIFDRDGILTAEFIRDYIPEDKKIITSSTHLNPVDSLAGRPVLVGYPGWLWTREINYGPREQSLKDFYADPVFNLNSFYISGAQYVLLDSVATSDWKASKEVFDAHFTRMFSNNSFSFYKLR